MSNSGIEQLVFWHYALSIHQSALLRSLAASSGAAVTLVLEKELDPQRKEMGWHTPDMGKTQIIIRPTPQAQSALLAGKRSTSAHIFWGTRGGGRMVWDTFRQSLSSNLYLGVYSEAFNGAGLPGAVRLARGRWDALRQRERVDLILGTGKLGVRWYERSGFMPERIFPFGYFVETPCPTGSGCSGQQVLSEDRFDLIFVGYPFFRKGLDILLRALQGIDVGKWRMHIVGDGKDRPRYVKLGERLGLADSIRFHGTLPNAQAIDLIGKSDLLVLPSRWDGWGAVVNEALMGGVPAVCSDRCGAADLVDGGERGEVVRAGSVSSLHSALARRISQGKKDAGTSARIRDWSKCISGESGAEYFMAVLKAARSGGNRPIPPWLRPAGDAQDSVPPARIV